MPFPEPDPDSFPPIFVTYCIDYRFNALTAEFLDEIGYEKSYYVCSSAGAALSLGYEKSCENIKKNDCRCDNRNHQNTDCCPGFESLKVLKKSFVTNLQIALTLKPINTIYLINHQDCGAIRAFLPCSGYPKVEQDKKNKEICINAKILTYANEYVKRKFENFQVILGLIDSNGSVADYDTVTKKWVIIYVGTQNNNTALWYGYNVGDVVTINC